MSHTERENERQMNSKRLLKLKNHASVMKILDLRRFQLKGPLVTLQKTHSLRERRAQGVKKRGKRKRELEALSKNTLTPSWLQMIPSL